jgi:hypothetical protein
MTMDLYGHLLGANLWVAAGRIGDISGTSSKIAATQEAASERKTGR